MSKCTIAALIALLCVSGSPAADDSIAQSIERGVKYLKNRHASNTSGTYAFGNAALVGIALLESGVPANDATIKNITKFVRANALIQSKTYELSLAIMYLDRLGDRIDRPAIQLLAVQIIAGQHQLGSWGYGGHFALSATESERFRKLFYDEERLSTKEGTASEQPALHPEVARYLKSIEAEIAAERKKGDESLDNSNTQFAVMALWIARRHGFACDDALTLAEKRFRATQRRDGGWSYTANDVLGNSPALMTTAPMTCAGLLGLAAGRGIRLTALRSKSTTPANPNPNPSEKSNASADQAVAAGFKYLERALANPKVLVPPRGFADLRDNLYFLWSLERVATIYDVDVLGATNWYKWGADSLVKSQSADGSWAQRVYTGATEEINTAFALLFLTRANLARDLTATLKGKANVKLPDRVTNPEPVKVDPPISPASSEFDAEANRLCNALVSADPAKRAGVLAQLRDNKGSVYTEGLVRAIARLKGDQQREAREALALRLKRMTAITLREMFKDANREIRSAAAAACGLKEDRQFVPDLISALNDVEDLVVQSARTSLRTFSMKDFGPSNDASAADKAKAATAWKAWWASQPK